MSRFAFSFVLLINALLTNAQELRPPVTNFTPKNYGTSQTPDNYCVFQDQRGYIFAGNAGGVLIYDGLQWDFVKVEQGAYVFTIDQDKNGTIYVGTSNGEFGKLTRDKNGGMKFVSLKAVFEKNKLELGTITKLFCVDDLIYIHTPENLFCIQGKKVSVIPTGSSYQIMLRCENRIYVRERGVGLVEIDGTTKKTLSTVYEFSDYGILGVVKYDPNQLLVVTQEKGLWLYNTRNRQAMCFNADSVGLKKHGIIGARNLSNGEFALNTTNSGVLIVDANGKVKNTINKSTGLRVNYIRDILEDKHRNLWLAMTNGIALVNHGSLLHYYDDETGLLGGVECIVKLDELVYVGTSEGLFAESANDPLKHFNQVNNVTGEVADLVIYKNSIIAATSRGVFSGNKTSFKELYSGVIHTIAVLPQKEQLLIAGPESVLLIDLKTNRILFEEYFETIIARCLSLTVDPASTAENTVVWMGSVGQGIFKISVINDKIGIEKFDNLDEHSLHLIRPAIIYNKVYFCTNGGLRKMITGDDGKPFFDLAGILPSLDGSQVTHVKQTNKRIWVCADNKIFHFDTDKKPVTIPFLPIDMGRINNIYAEDERNCWIAAADGLVRYKENYTKNYSQEFTVALRKVVVNNDSTLFKGNWFANGKFMNAQPANSKFELAYKFNSYEFTITALYFEEADKILYTHMLEGHDASWSSWSNENKIKYSNLREGNYTLRIKAKNVFGYQSKVLKFSFTILPPWYRTTWAYIAYGVATILLFIAVNRILSHRLKQKNIQLEAIVKKRTQEIEKKNEELAEQNEQIKHQKQEITDSINYAQKIQEAMLPFAKEMVVDFPDSFVLFKPKDIVSGDFYWYGKYDGKMVIICADCTGHGVPGAFMSMLCIDKLNQIIPEKKILMPDKILEAANRGIKKSLGQGDEQNLKMKDGMDCAIVTVDPAKKMLYYSGANRTLYRIRKNEIEEFKPDKCAVGGFTPEEMIYNLHEIPYEPGDRFYMSTDGYADQFGGPRGKKIMVKTFKDILLNNYKKKQKEQSQVLDKFIEDWKQHPDGENEGHEQVDDVCVIGFTI
ncbi:MAG TPA: SpoIIE family protein phosphatase [Flavobacteriales bacterium]|nr:SpoIIE family protein phosphatase [Flavobacteriales bacterium]